MLSIPGNPTQLSETGTIYICLLVGAIGLLVLGSVFALGVLLYAVAFGLHLIESRCFGST